MPIHHVCLLTVLFTVAVILGACTEDTAEAPQSAAESPAMEAQSRPGAGEVENPAGPAIARSPSPEGASVFFISPADGDTVTSPFVVEFGISRMDVVKAGEDQPASGHHHIIVDAELPNLDTPIPASDNYIHFGDASTSTELALGPGKHTLQLLLGDYRHVPHDPPVLSERITITVE